MNNQTLFIITSVIIIVGYAILAFMLRRDHQKFMKRHNYFMENQKALSDTLADDRLMADRLLAGTKTHYTTLPLDIVEVGGNQVQVNVSEKDECSKEKTIDVIIKEQRKYWGEDKLNVSYLLNNVYYKDRKDFADYIYSRCNGGKITRAGFYGFAKAYSLNHHFSKHFKRSIDKYNSATKGLFK